MWAESCEQREWEENVTAGWHQGSLGCLASVPLLPPHTLSPAWPHSLIAPDLTSLLPAHAGARTMYFIQNHSEALGSHVSGSSDGPHKSQSSHTIPPCLQNHVFPC